MYDAQGVHECSCTSTNKLPKSFFLLLFCIQHLMEAHKAEMEKQDNGVIRLVRSGAKDSAKDSTEVACMYIKSIT